VFEQGWEEAERRGYGDNQRAAYQDADDLQAGTQVEWKRSDNPKWYGNQPPEQQNL